MLTIGLPGFLAAACYIIIFGFGWRLLAGHLAARNPESAVAKAMAFIY